VFVFDREKEVAQLRVVKTGIQDNRYIAVLEGLKEGEEVITGPYEEVARNLNAGAKVKEKKEQTEEEEEK
jgi:HlyD family secretion protein